MVSLPVRVSSKSVTSRRTAPEIETGKRKIQSHVCAAAARMSIGEQ